MKKLRFVDTFAGIGGFHIGMHNAFGDNAECVAFVEIDSAPRAVYNNNFNKDGSVKELSLIHI